MRGVGDEVSLTPERLIEAFEHPVERVGQLLELIGGPVQGDPLPQVLPRDPPRGSGDLAERTQRPAGQHPSGHDGHERHHSEREQVLDEEPVQRVGPELRADRCRHRRLGGAGREPERSAERGRAGGGQHPELLQLAPDLAEVGAGVEVVADEQVAERQEHGAGDQEHHPVEDGQAQPDRGSRPAHHASL